MVVMTTNGLSLKNYFYSRFLKLSQRVVGPVAIACLGYFGWGSRNSILSIIDSAEGYFWVTAILLLVIRNLFQAVHTNLILRGLGSFVSWWKVQQITIQRLPARYIPGGIWHSAAQVVDLKSLGVPFERLSTMFIVQQVLAIGTALGVGGLGLALNHFDRHWVSYGAWTSGTAFVGIAVCFFIVQVISKRKGLHLLPHFLFYAFIMSIFFWLVPAFSFITFVTGFSEIEITATSLLIGSVFIFSRGIGFLVIVAPQGIGVFEFVAAALLPSNYEAASIAVILLSFRIIGFLADTVTYGLYLAMKYIPAFHFLFDEQDKDNIRFERD